VFFPADSDSEPEDEKGLTIEQILKKETFVGIEDKDSSAAQPPRELKYTGIKGKFMSFIGLNKYEDDHFTAKP